MLWTSIIVAFHLMGLVSAVHAVMGTRTPQGAIAWAVSLLTFPYLTVPAYWVLGRSKFQGYVKKRRSSSRAGAEIREKVNKSIGPYIVSQDDGEEATLAAVRLAQLPVTRGNNIELLIDGEATFKSILQGIEQAKDYILFQFYIVKNDRIGTEVQQALVSKAKQGVRVYFLYDEIGSIDLPSSYTKALRQAGVEVSAFNSRKGRGNRFQLNFRNHRKTVVVDGKVAWVGGHNIGDEYLSRDPKFGHWRDTHVRFEGPAALSAQIAFLEDWVWATGARPQLSWTAFPSSVPQSDSQILVIPSGPADTFETANLMFVGAINTAKEKIWIASPYFVPDHSITVALQLAALRGVDVRILIPDKPDHLMVYLAAYSYFDDVGEAGVQFYRYTKGFLHEKAMLIDNSVATVGTANFDNRSFRLNFEMTVAASNEKFVNDVKEMFEEDFSNSRLMESGEYSRKPWWFRFGVRLARLSSPIQ